MTKGPSQGEDSLCDFCCLRRSTRFPSLNECFKLGGCDSGIGSIGRWQISGLLVLFLLQAGP
jgi:hypothetical protein